MNTEKLCPLNQFNPCKGESCSFYLKVESVEVENKKYEVDIVNIFPSFPCAIPVTGMKAILDFVIPGLKPC